MSLSSLLLAAGPKKIDSELDALFKSNVTAIYHGRITSNINVASPASSCTCRFCTSNEEAKNRGSYPRPSREKEEEETESARSQSTKDCETSCKAQARKKIKTRRTGRRNGRG
jgi:hypothetical protein